MATPTCLPQFGGGSIESRDGESFEGVGETRLTTGTIFTDKLFTGQREMAGLGIYHYNAIASWRIDEKGEASNVYA